MNSIIQKDDLALRKKAIEVAAEEFADPHLAKTIFKMAEVLFQEPDGIGIAAPQIGISKQIFLVAADVLRPAKLEQRIRESDKTKNRKPLSFASEDYLVFINPALQKTSQKKAPDVEGCLSVRGLYGQVRRSEKVTIKYCDEQGKKHVHGASGLFARVLQHEIDHLNGVLFIDKAENIKTIDS
ncbi:hypothetical protein A3J56_03020 [Candidatus Giovannonibacteria bacterium RIFCSPHIGHO2_02_FULL_46_20]|uniref:Peptide deformylase n=1 Tax=Candidatus Giovannonibacteria bacterium RIFCSPHIGHO2_02_FULL_46_20 TaxID=1798338 RepID=A0A1F5WGZ8_9BACT|nr:MAG: hypothetical protein A3J56_03020 [Candidatus Giovannonibacteria bacterium RIFCSPHIGHO2_02_FULL_46_20]